MASSAMSRRRQTDFGGGNGSDDRQRRLRNRNIAVAAILGVLAVLFYIVAIVKMGGG